MKQIFFTLLLAGLCLHTATAQWNVMSTGLPDSVLVFRISSPSPEVVWGTSIDWGIDFSIEPQPYIVRTTDGGATWTTSMYTNSFSQGAISIAALDENTAFVITFDFATGEGRVYRTTDGGAYWQELDEANNGIALADPFGFPNVIHFWDDKNGIIVGDPDITGYFEIYTTRDGGDHWVRSMDPDLLAADDGSEYGNFEGFGTNGANTCFFSTFYPHHRIFKSDDRGLTWHEVVSPLKGDEDNPSALSSIVFEDERRGLAFVQFNPNNPGFGEQVPQLYTDDGGETWHFNTTANYNEYQERGIAVKVPGADCQFAIGHYNQAVSYTDDCGESYDYDPSIAGVGLQMHSPKDGWLSLFYLGGTGGEVARFTGNLSPSTMRNVTLRVNMSGTSVSPAGVHVATNLNGWSTTATPMMNMGNGDYEVTLQVATGTQLRYKFINGNAWGQNESVPAGCGSLNSAGAYDRSYTVGEWDARLPAVCFSACMGCGDRVPSGAFYCAPGSLQCEIFDWYNAGSLSLQGAGGWSGNANVTGYWHGYTNHSGGRALHVGSGNHAIYKLGNRTGSTYELSMKMYVPRDHEAHFSLLSDQNNPNSHVFDYALHTNRTVWAADGSYKSYPQDKWVDVKMEADATTGHLHLWVNGVEAWQGAVSGFLQLGGIAFHGDKYTDFLVDDISLRDLNANFNKPTPGIAKSMTEGNVYPNPTSDVLFVPYQFENAGDLALTLLDATGRNVIFNKISDAQAGVEALQLNGLLPGIYILKIKHPDVERTERVVVQRL